MLNVEDPPAVRLADLGSAANFEKLLLLPMDPKLRAESPWPQYNSLSDKHGPQWAKTGGIVKAVINTLRERGWELPSPRLWIDP